MLEIEDLKVYFRTNAGKVKAVDGVSFEVKRREKFTLIGESGSGKSVLAQAILRLLPKNAEVSGKVLFDGRDLIELGEEDMRKIRGREIAWIPQSQSSLNPVLTVGFQCAEPVIEHFRTDKRSVFARVVRLFEFLGIGRSRVKDYPHQFSGGMRQRVLVAMGISADPKLIIAHDLNFAENLADRIAVMYCGKIVEVSPAKEFFSEPLHPYSRGLLDSLPSRGLKPIKGFQPSMINPPKGCRFRDRCEFASERCKSEPPLINLNGRFVRCWLYDRR